MCFWSITVPDNDQTAVGNHVANHLEPNCNSDQEPSPVPESEPLQQKNHFQPDEVESQQEEVQENGQSSEGEMSLGSEGEEDTPRRYPSPCQLKKIRNQESQELNSELRVLITKEIRKPGRRTSHNNSMHVHTLLHHLCSCYCESGRDGRQNRNRWPHTNILPCKTWPAKWIDLILLQLVSICSFFFDVFKWILQIFSMVLQLLIGLPLRKRQSLTYCHYTRIAVPLKSLFCFVNAGYEKIFYLLKQIQGSLETRLIFLQNIIKEAARYSLFKNIFVWILTTD